MKGRRREGYVPSAGSLHKCPPQPRLGYAKSRSQDLSLGFSHGWQQPKSMGHHLLPPRVHFSMKLCWNRSQHSNPCLLVFIGCSGLSLLSGHQCSSLLHFPVGVEMAPLVICTNASPSAIHFLSFSDLAKGGSDPHWRAGTAGSSRPALESGPFRNNVHMLGTACVKNNLCEPTNTVRDFFLTLSLCYLQPKSNQTAFPFYHQDCRSSM